MNNTSLTGILLSSISNGPVQSLVDPAKKAIPLYEPQEINLSFNKEKKAMFQKIYIFNRIVQPIAGAFLLALIVAGVLGITRVSAASSTTNAA